VPDPTRMVKAKQPPQISHTGLSRRQFLGSAFNLGALAAVPVHAVELLKPVGRTFRDAIIGHTGHEITPDDAHPATENIGPVAGDDIVAEFAFDQGVHATFTSRAKNREPAGPWGMELIGSQGSMMILLEMVPRIYRLKDGNWTTAGKTSEWRQWEQDPTLNWAESERGFSRANERVVNDWLAAITQDREPMCNGYAGMKALEMVMAVFAAGLVRGRVAFPLKNRQHPLNGGR
jgi:hypothetical protein